MRLLLPVFSGGDAGDPDALAAVLGMTSTAVSHQLRLLKQADLVRSRRVGKVVYYTLADDHVQQIAAQGYAHITEEE